MSPTHFASAQPYIDVGRSIADGTSDPEMDWPTPVPACVAKIGQAHAGETRRLPFIDGRTISDCD